MSAPHELRRWPALSGLGELPESLPVERAVWGKVHGQRSDFRWIARSPGFGDAGLSLEHEIALGTEDQPRDTVCWRSLDELRLAVHVYPSRARDGSGRTGFVEKQILLFRSRPSFPAALAAMTLLPRVGALGDEIWWAHHESTSWSELDFALELDAGASPPIAVTAQAAAAAIERGAQALSARVARRDLIAFYSDLVERRRPAPLRGLEAPLPPEALAALLLPLPPALAEATSLAGWLPSSRAAADELAARWDAVVVPPGTLAAPAEGRRASPPAEELASALLEGDPDRLGRRPPTHRPGAPPVPRERTGELDRRVAIWRAQMVGRLPRPGLLLPLTEPPGGSPILDRLYEFARSADRRWLDLDEITRESRRPGFVPPDPRLLADWIRETDAYRPPGVDREQWDHKVELLRETARRLAGARRSLHATDRV